MGYFPVPLRIFCMVIGYYFSNIGNGIPLIGKYACIHDSDYGNQLVTSVEGLTLKMIDGTYYLHCEEGEYIKVFDEKLWCRFYVDGVAYRIEDLPWSNETKLMLKFRHGDCGGALLYEI
jgi:hypothetical protein